MTNDFDQNILNEIVLWKVNRYANFDSDLITLINTIKRTEKEINIDQTSLVLKGLLKTKGVQLSMASSILRFRNPNIYQIIDQRVFRIIYPNKKLNVNTYPSEKNINYQIEIYLKYLKDLKKVSSDLNIPFDQSDRILFMADKRINKEHKLKNFS